MSWIDLLWPMIAASSLTLAAVHLVIWARQQTRRSSFLFALAAASVAVISICELLLMRAAAPEEYGDILRWAHVPGVVLVISLVGFVLVHFRAGSVYLAAAACVARVACLVPNFLSGANLNFRTITELRSVATWGGDSVVLPAAAVVNPWMLLADTSILLFVLFLASAIVEVWRRGSREERRSVVVICGSMVLFLLSAIAWNMAAFQGRVAGPLAISPAFVCVLLAVAYELGGDMLRASKLAEDLGAAELGLRNTRRKMDQAVRAADVGLLVWDIAGGTSWLSDHAAVLMGLEPGDSFDQARLMARVHPDDLQNFDAALLEATQAGGNYRCEYRVLLPDGRTRWIVTRGQVELDAAGAPLRMDGVVIDITGRKDAEERFRMVVETAPIAMLVIDLEGRISLANQQAEELLGYSRAELSGMHVDLVVPGGVRYRDDGDRTKFIASTRAIGAGSGLFGLHKDGREIPIDIALNPIPMESGQFALVSVMDLSERIRLEREFVLQRDELAHLSRIALLAELSGSLAHELNQPLTAILANAQAAVRFMDQDTPNLGEVREALVNVVESDKRAGDVIRRLRALLRKERSEYAYVDVNDVVLDVLRIIRSDLLNRGVEMALQLAEDLPRVQGDPVQLQQVLLNLIMNASDAMADLAQGRELMVRTELSQPDCVTVSVCDVGKGIQADEIERIFSPFVTTKSDGLGLGLAVCRTIITAHGGGLWAANNAGAGATVSFSLPVNGNLDAAGSGQR